MICIGNQTAFAAQHPLEPYEYALANGFDAFEWFPDKHDDAGWDEADLDAPARERIRETAAACGLRLSVHAPWQANPLDSAAQDRLQASLDLARDLGAVLLNIHLGHEQSLPAFVAALQPWLERTAKAGVRLAIENTPHHAPELFNELFELLRASAVPASHVGMCLDLGHANLCTATHNDYLGFVDRLDPRVPIIHLHLHENWGDADTHLALFTGPAARNDAGLRGLVERLQARGYDGSAILEQWPQPRSLLNQARDRLRTLWGLPPSDLGQPARRHTAPEPDGPEPASAASNATAPQPSATSVELAAQESFAAALLAGDRRSRSWREKLEAVRVLLSAQSGPLTEEQWADLAIYLRWLRQGQVRCEEDGRHFRPGHHAGIAERIRELLDQLAGPEHAFLLRRIYPSLPSSAPAFRSAEPLTRIRDIAHRNDIPADLKREIKHSLQNKLHRCAGPEDLVTATRLLEKVAAPNAGYSPGFVHEFKLFHAELADFFNARSLEQQLEALRPRAGQNEGQQIRSLLAWRPGASLDEQLSRYADLTRLRQWLAGRLAERPGPETRDLLLTDISLEDFAFVRVSETLNLLAAMTAQFRWREWLEVLRLTALNLALSAVQPEESSAIASEVEAWAKDFSPGHRDELLRLKASVERAGRLAEDYCDRMLALFPRRVERLGQALGVASQALRDFAEADIRAHVIFQLSKIAAELLRKIRLELALPPWDVLVAGRAVGRLQEVATLEAWSPSGQEQVLLLLDQAAGDEEIPSGVAGIVLAHDLPHLSHLGVRARQAGVVLVTCAEVAARKPLAELAGKVIALTAAAQKVEWHAAESAPVAPVRSAPLVLKASRHEDQSLWLELDAAVPECAGAKADGVRRLAELARRDASGFKTPAALVVPFAAFDQALHRDRTVAEEFQQQVPMLSSGPCAGASAASARIRELIAHLELPTDIVAVVQRRFGDHARVMVRSSANCEDLAGLAGAGLYESVPNVPVNELAAAVRAVWASLWSDRAVLSRHLAGIPHDQARMAVLIQQMLPADLSFVLHTVNPVDQDSNWVYGELAVGLGETLVSGAVRGQPYRWVGHKHAQELKWLSFASFSRALLPATEGGLKRLTLDYSRIRVSHNAGYRDPLARRLTDLGAQIEQNFRSPQDIEGVLVADEVYLVQARPQQGLGETGG